MDQNHWFFINRKYLFFPNQRGKFAKSKTNRRKSSDATGWAKKRQSELKITLQQRAQKFHTVQNRKVTGKKQQLACLRKPKKYPTNTSGTEIPSHMHSSASIVLNGT